jgi:hypothetical protein
MKCLEKDEIGAEHEKKYARQAFRRIWTDREQAPSIRTSDRVRVKESLIVGRKGVADLAKTALSPLRSV